MKTFVMHIEEQAAKFVENQDLAAATVHRLAKGIAQDDPHRASTLLLRERLTKLHPILDSVEFLRTERLLDAIKEVKSGQSRKYACRKYIAMVLPFVRQYRRSLAAEAFVPYQEDDLDPMHCSVADVVALLNRPATATPARVGAAGSRELQFRPLRSAHNASRSSVKAPPKETFLRMFIQSFLGEMLEAGIPSRTDICRRCRRKMVVLHARAMFACLTCGMQVKFTDICVNYNTQNPNEDKEITIPGKRISHLNDWLSVLQAKRRNKVPPHVMESIRAEIRTKNIDPTQIKADWVQDKLKELKMSDCYTFAFQIGEELNGESAIQLNPKQEAMIRRWFNVVQTPFRKYCSLDRKNMFSYPYIVYKLCEHLGYTSELHKFRLLKSDKLLAQADAVWKIICEELEWEYIPTTSETCPPPIPLAQPHPQLPEA